MSNENPRKEQMLALLASLPFKVVKKPPGTAGRGILLPAENRAYGVFDTEANTIVVAEVNEEVATTTALQLNLAALAGRIASLENRAT